MSIPFRVSTTRRSAASTTDARFVQPRSQSWLYRYAARARFVDLVVVLTAVLVALIVRFGYDLTHTFGSFSWPAIVAALLIAVSWFAMLRVTQSSDRRVLGGGPTEYSRVVTSSVMTFGVFAIVCQLLNLSIARGFLAVAFPLGTVMLLLARWGMRRHLVGMRKSRKYLERVLIMGGVRSAKPMIDRLQQNPELGYEVVGLCVPIGKPSDPEIIESFGYEIPVFGDFSDARSAVALSGATTVAVTSAEVLGHSAMRELSWDLDDMDVEMLVSPGVTDVAGPRMMVRPVAGLPLLHIDKPSYQGANQFLKSAFDRIATSLLLLMLSPVLLACAIAVKVTSPGPVFYKGERIGVGNEAFPMWKFRSMVVDADQQRELLAAQNQGNGVLFKIQDDPRVTRVGKFLRRYSLDELPQLFNVMGGSMSLVGPRPPLREEVETYDHVVTRRMLVRPGITGLWQVSGRSDLSWEESVRLDLSYVENWSIMQDVLILWRTARAVRKSDGAY
ncbi:sugar transferase [Williamsia phyllosphaerae]|uniref:Polyprenyl glycosylphosphotransferase n=1 Tax=Williamsia phyllosphaerae TaxID=885042 RepID=A0ABQ1UWJ5_9NOCA|nr:sugar transferase [Williamsia phyllosphaerae]GGF28711.1 polyprenyl glycosylphosphotransferase [Williamsia phyllosphaerae]